MEMVVATEIIATITDGSGNAAVIARSHLWWPPFVRTY